MGDGQIWAPETVTSKLHCAENLVQSELRKDGSPVPPEALPSISLDHVEHPHRLRPCSLLSSAEQMPTNGMALGMPFRSALEDALKLPYAAGDEGNVYRREM